MRALKLPERGSNRMDLWVIQVFVVSAGPQPSNDTPPASKEGPDWGTVLKAAVRKTPSQSHGKNAVAAPAGRERRREILADILDAKI